MSKEISMRNKTFLLTGLLLAAIFAASVFYCVKPGDSTTTSGTNSEETEFTLSGEAI